MDRRDLLKSAALMLGASVSSSCSRALLSGADLAQAPTSGVLSDREQQKVAAIAELIIPQTDTAGATEAGVPEFIHRIVAEWYTPFEREVFLTGLRGIDETSRVEFGADFLALPHDRQIRVLESLERTAEGVRGLGGNSPFFAKIKELTVLGYYTSAVGSQQELVYRPVPGAYRGHAHFNASSRQWTE